VLSALQEPEDESESLVSVPPLLECMQAEEANSEEWLVLGSRQKFLWPFHILKFHLKGGFGYGLCDR
jgi:hypothetical protein